MERKLSRASATSKKGSVQSRLRSVLREVGEGGVASVIADLPRRPESASLLGRGGDDDLPSSALLPALVASLSEDLTIFCEAALRAGVLIGLDLLHRQGASPALGDGALAALRFVSAVHEQGSTPLARLHFSMEGAPLASAAAAAGDIHTLNAALCREVRQAISPFLF